MTWSYFNPVRVLAGEGSLEQVHALLPAEGNVLAVTTAGWVRRGAVERVLAQLDRRRVAVHAGVTPNPQLDDLEKATAAYLPLRPAVILALGGGSAIDTEKVLSMTLSGCGSNDLRERLAGDPGSGPWKAIPLVAVPTTAGSGAEATPFATVWDATSHRKHSLADRALYPQVAVLDPGLTLSLGPDDTLYSGMDAVSHALESLWNRSRNPVSEAHAVRALELAVAALPRLLDAEARDMASRFRMQCASLLAGQAISQTRTAIAHSISYPLTAHYNVPHGLACSFTLARILESYLESNPEPDHRSLLLRVGRMIESLDLGARLAKYVDQAQLDALKGEMIHKGRADNFTGQIDLDSFVSL